MIHSFNCVLCFVLFDYVLSTVGSDYIFVSFRKKKTFYSKKKDTSLHGLYVFYGVYVCVSLANKLFTI